MRDEKEIQFRVLELEYKDFLSRREVIHYAQWAIPLGWFTGVLTAGLVHDGYDLAGVIIIAIGLYAVVKRDRVKNDYNLEALRIITSHLLEEENLPPRLEPEPPAQLTTRDRIVLFAMFLGFTSFAYFQMRPPSIFALVAYLGLLALVLLWFLRGIGLLRTRVHQSALREQ